MKGQYDWTVNQRNFYPEYIMGKNRLDEAQTGMEIDRRITSNLRYADDTTIMAESQEELEPLIEGERVKSRLKSKH